MDLHIFEELITKFCNNMIGCAYYAGMQKCEYHDIFNEEKLLKLLNEIYNFLETKKLDNDYINELMKILKNDEKTSNKYMIFQNLLSLTSSEECNEENNLSR